MPWPARVALLVLVSLVTRGLAAPHPVVQELCASGDVAGGLLLPGLKELSRHYGVSADLARQCGDFVPETVCESDWQLQNASTRLLVERANQWPGVINPGSPESARAGNTHGSGFRGTPALPMARGVMTSRRVGDTNLGRAPVTRPPGAEGRDPCKERATNASRLSAVLLEGDEVLVMEAWWVPTAFPPPFPGSNWFGSVLQDDPLDTPMSCPLVSQEELPRRLPSTGLMTSVTTAQARSSYVSGLSGCDHRSPFPGNGSSCPVSDRAHLSGFSLNRNTAGPGTGPGYPVAGPTFQPSGIPPMIYRDRPHQVLSLMVVRPHRLGMLQLPVPGSTAFSGPWRPGVLHPLVYDTRGKAALRNHSRLSQEAKLLTTSSMFVDGIGTGLSCSFHNSLPKPVQVVASWSEARQRSPNLASCLGGHNSSCDANGWSCGSLMDPIFLNESNILEAGCVPSFVAGSTGWAGDVRGPTTVGEFGSLSMAAWWKPCPACRAAALSSSASGGRRAARECDYDECLANTTRLLQRRLVTPRRVPLPAALGALREADGGRFDWYACRPTSPASYLAGRPRCQPLCESGLDPGRDWQGQQIAWIDDAADEGGSHTEAGTAGRRGMMAGRSWLMGWSGARATERSPGLAGRCTPALGVLGKLRSSGRLRVAMRRGQHSAMDAWLPLGLSASLLSPLLSSASVDVTLRVPVGQLRRASRDAFLLDLATEAAVAAAGSVQSCVTAECVHCPDGSDTAIWGNRSLDPATGQPFVASRATPLETLRVRLIFLPLGTEGCEYRGSTWPSKTWLVDARRGWGVSGRWTQSHEPVAFSGPGSNLSWADNTPEAASIAAQYHASEMAVAAKSPALLAASLAAAVGSGSSHRVMGMWLVWASPTDNPSPVAVARTRCLTDGLGSFESGRWWRVGDCTLVVSTLETAALAAYVALSVLSVAVAVLAPSCRRCCACGRATAAMRKVSRQARMWECRALAPLVMAAARALQLGGCAWLTFVMGRLNLEAAVLASGAVALHAMCSVVSAVAAIRRTEARVWDPSAEDDPLGKDLSAQTIRRQTLAWMRSQGGISLSGLSLLSLVDADTALAAAHPLSRSAAQTTRYRQLASVPSLSLRLERADLDVEAAPTTWRLWLGIESARSTLQASAKTSQRSGRSSPNSNTVKSPPPNLKQGGSVPRLSLVSVDVTDVPDSTRLPVVAAAGREAAAAPASTPAPGTGVKSATKRSARVVPSFAAIPLGMAADPRAGHQACNCVPWALQAFWSALPELASLAVAGWTIRSVFEDRATSDILGRSQSRAIIEAAGLPDGYEEQAASMVATWMQPQLIAWLWAGAFLCVAGVLMRAAGAVGMRCLRYGMELHDQLESWSRPEGFEGPAYAGPSVQAGSVSEISDSDDHDSGVSM